MDLNGHHDKNILWPKAYFCIVSNHFILLERIGGVLVSFSEKNEIDGSDSKAKLELEKKTSIYSLYYSQLQCVYNSKIIF